VAKGIKWPLESIEQLNTAEALLSNADIFQSEVKGVSNL